MSNYQQIPEAIRSALAVAGAVPDDRLADLARTYANLCRDANQRLRRCAEYLRRGMRCEAVHLAGCAPDLLEMTRALQTAETPEWERCCRDRGWEVAPRLLSADLPHLAEAPRAQQPLEPLLARHRVLALGRAPLAERLRLLRAIAAADPGNPLWPAELRDLEAVRFKEMFTQMPAAFKGADEPALQRLQTELTQERWQSPVPEQLTAGLAAALARLRLDRAMAHLRGLLDALLAAREAQAVDRCSALMTQWRTAVESKGITLPIALQEKIRPLALWLAAEQRRRGIARKMQSLQPVLLDQRARARRAVLRRRAAGAILAAAALGGAAFFFLHGLRK